MMQHILLIEDEDHLAAVLEFNLSSEGYQVTVASDGQEGLRCWLDQRPDLVVLDVMLPKIDGHAVCRAARAAGLHTPVLFLSAKGQPSERVEGLAAGGDDYLSKPFHLPEFLGRIQAMLRRAAWLQQPLEHNSSGNHPNNSPNSYSFAGLVVDFLAFTVTGAQGSEALGQRELLLLRLFIRRANQVVSRDEVLDALWGADQFPSSRTVDNFVMKLRKIIEVNPSQPQHLHTIWGVGYKFTPIASGGGQP
jgi:two-component system, OmpR family, alkaline phosphatase synthesis response regulator PhoP